MKITVIEMSHDEAMGLFLAMKGNEEPEIKEIHEDFAPELSPQPAAVEKPKAKKTPHSPSQRGKQKGKPGRPRKNGTDGTDRTDRPAGQEPAAEEPEELPR